MLTGVSCVEATSLGAARSRLGHARLGSLCPTPWAMLLDM